MAWATEVNATQITGLTTTETAFQVSAADMKISAAPNDTVLINVRGNTTGTTDHLIVRIYSSSDDAPGAVPDSAQTLAGSDWAIYQEFRITNDRDNEWITYVVRNAKNIAVSVVGTGATDTWTVDLRYSIGTP